MLFLNKIYLTQFKNYQASQFNFSENIIAISGKNGIGKTNLLDAIFYLCFTKSYFHNSDNYAVQFGKQGMRLEGYFANSVQNLHVVCIHRGNGKKEFYLNDEMYEKFSAHIGKLPCVIITPDDVELIIGASDERRKFIDTMISQWDNEYLQHLIRYQKVLLQRNSLLKSLTEHKQVDIELLEVLTAQLIEPGNLIYTIRKNFLKEFIPLVQQLYHLIAAKNETVEMQYESQLKDDNFEKLLLISKQKDIVLQRTNVGIHKDDFSILLNSHIFKHSASQGQRKSLLFALKLAEFETIKAKKGFAPLLLLDDIFEKLDDIRMNHLLEKVCKESGSQIFITDTSKERLSRVLQNLNVAFQSIEL